MQDRPRNRANTISSWKLAFKGYALIGGACFLVGFLLFLPSIVEYENAPRPQAATPFPVTVDPVHKTITEDPVVDAQLSGNSSLTGAVIETAGLFNHLAATVVEAPIYQSLTGTDDHIVIIPPGDRKEQVASAFGAALDWSTSTQEAFLVGAATTQPELAEGEFQPGTYVVHASTTPAEVQSRISAQFNADVRSHYASSTQSIVPMDEALTIASLIEREAGDTDQMRIISGIIWNRIFADMRLQLDASVQYAVANATDTGAWWPDVTPHDLTIKSPYNTYRNAGLPPTPIATPSVAAVLAALNPVQTDCLYYFHDADRGFHCSATYAEHVALLKRYFGHGK